MKARLLFAGLVFISSNSYAGALPEYWYQCLAQGYQSENPTPMLEWGSGFDEEQASESALYFCETRARLMNCEIVSCSYERLRHVSGERKSF